jgi:hypothetical protein
MVNEFSVDAALGVATCMGPGFAPLDRRRVCVTLYIPRACALTTRRAQVESDASPLASRLLNGQNAQKGATISSVTIGGAHLKPFG